MSVCSSFFRAALVAAPLFGVSVFSPAPVAVAQSSFGDVQLGRLNEQQAAEILQKIRSVGIGEVCFRFTIKHVPRKSDDTLTYTGTLWAGRRDNENVFRIELDPPPGDKSGKAPLRIFLKSGASGGLWTNTGPGGAPVRADSSSNAPFYAGLILTPLELQTPFLHWPDVKYTNTARFRGRPTHFFKAVPPAAFKAANPKIGHVQFGTDKGFGDFVVLQAIVYDTKGEPLRKFEAESFTNVKGVYIPEEMRALDTVTRDKDVFRVTAAAVGLKHPEGIFDPRTLGETAPRPMESRFQKID